MLNEFYRIAFRKRIYATISELQKDLDVWMTEYNEARPHQGRYCFGKMPMQTFLDARTIAQEKTDRRTVHRSTGGMNINQPAPAVRQIK